MTDHEHAVFGKLYLAWIDALSTISALIYEASELGQEMTPEEEKLDSECILIMASADAPGHETTR